MAIAAKLSASPRAARLRCFLNQFSVPHQGTSVSAAGVELTDPSKLQLIYAGIAAVCAGVACVFDIRNRRIPNRLTGPIFLVGLAAHTFFSGWKGLTDAMVAAFVGGIVFLLFYLAGGMGAGDVKLMAATASVVGLPSIGSLLISTGIAGGLLALGVSVTRGVLRQTMANTFALTVHHRLNGLSPHPKLNLRNPDTIRLPYAVPVAVGCLCVVAKAMVQR